MSPNLERISLKARANPDRVFPSLSHHIADIEHLRTCFQRLKGNTAVGVDEVTKTRSAEDLEANLHELSAGLKRMGYRPQPKRRVYIPKPGSEQGRPLGISSVEDQSVELATKRVVEPLFESVLRLSYGYRPGRGPHQCLDTLGRTIQQKRGHHLVEADIRGFFDAVSHEWLLSFCNHALETSGSSRASARASASRRDAKIRLPSPVGWSAERRASRRSMACSRVSCVSGRCGRALSACSKDSTASR